MSAVVPLKPAEPTERQIDLLALARSRNPSDRERLLLALTTLCRTSPGAAAGQSNLLSDIFVTLVRQAERDIRRSLARQLAEADWAPVALINMLALDEIEIARPIIAANPLLGEDQLLKILIEATLEHQIEVARRPALSGRLVDHIIDRGEPAVLTALASNGTAEVTEASLARLVEHSKRVAALRAPLVRHPRLSNQLASQLYEWVGAALRQAIGERFNVDAEKLDTAVRAATQAVTHPEPETPKLTAAQRDEMDRRLVAKLVQSGQLRAGYAIRALREQNVCLFEHALAALGGFPVQQVRTAVRAETPDLLALACNAAGMDRAVLPALFDELRRLTGGLPAGGDPRVPRVPRSPEQARREFKARFAAAAAT